MFTFDSFTLVPAYSDIMSRNEVNISTLINNTASVIPIINANMHSICTPDMINVISEQRNSFSSYHRFFKTKEEWYQTITNIEDTIKNKNLFFPSIGIKNDDIDAANKFIGELGFNNIIVDVNHGHHKAVSNIIKRIKQDFPKANVMAGNVSSTDGIKFLSDAGADIIKIGNSFGFSCTTIKMTGFGVHPIHVAKTFREETGNWDTPLCIDGGIRNTADIAKSLIWGNLVMIGKMFAGCDESKGSIIYRDNARFKTYWGNASIAAKTVQSDYVRFVEGAVTEVPYIGDLNATLNSICDGLQSAFSFVGARSLKEYQDKAPNQILMV